MTLGYVGQRSLKLILSRCIHFQRMSNFIVFPGPLPNLIGHGMFTQMSAFNRWLSRCHPANNVVFIENWQTFWGKPALIRTDGINPTLEGASLISRNQTWFLSKPKPCQPRRQSYSPTCLTAFPLEQLTIQNPIKTVCPTTISFNQNKCKRKSSFT